jgi:hypothetical protein
MADKRKPPRRGGSVTLPKGASKDNVDDALRGSEKKSPQTLKEKT